MDYQCFLYSADNSLRISDLKSGNYSEQYNISEVEQWMQDNCVHAALEGSDSYHHKFYAVRGKPYIYYFLGDSSLLNAPLLAIVGPRKMSAYAQEVLEQLFSLVKDYAIATISGMADGVDSLCHRLSLHYHIPTIAVLGSGLRSALSSSKRELIFSIAQAGCVISEFKLGQVATSYTFPQRNRLIAGLSHCLFLPEAGEKSGSLLTLSEACSLQKPVYGVPQTIFCPQSAGLLRMMQEGSVRIVANLEDFVKEEFGQYKRSSSFPAYPPNLHALSSLHQLVFSHIAKEAGLGISVDALCEKLSLDLGNLMSVLTELEIQSFVFVNSVGRYCVS